MGQVVVTIAGRTYRMNCEDGQEAHLQHLAGEVDTRMAELKESFGEIGDQRLAVMAALTVADELDAARRRIAALEAETGARTAELASVVDGAATRVERLVEMLNATRGPPP